MLDPLSLVPFALAAPGGGINASAAQQHVSAGITLLQRSAQLVRALAGRRAAMLLPLGPAVLTALAAADGRGTLLLEPDMPGEVWRAQLTAANVGAIFTIARFSSMLPSTMPHVLLDHAPLRAQVTGPHGARDVDLGSHFALDLAGEREAEGSDEECLLTFPDHSAEWQQVCVSSHRVVLQRARELAASKTLTPRDRVAVDTPRVSVASVVSVLAPLLVGADVYTAPLSSELRSNATAVFDGGF